MFVQNTLGVYLVMYNKALGFVLLNVFFHVPLLIL